MHTIFFQWFYRLLAYWISIGAFVLYDVANCTQRLVELIVEQGTLLVGIRHSGCRHVWYVTH